MYQSYKPLLEQYSDEIVNLKIPVDSSDKAIQTAFVPDSLVTLLPKNPLTRQLNPKQYSRILKRRMTRSKQKKFKRGTFRYEVRHQEALLRRRAPNGQFLGGPVNMYLQEPRVVIQRVGGEQSLSELDFIKEQSIKQEPIKHSEDSIGESDIQEPVKHRLHTSDHFHTNNIITSVEEHAMKQQSIHEKFTNGEATHLKEQSIKQETDEKIVVVKQESI